MAASCQQTGYQCEFVENVPEHFLCSKCALVARRLCFTSCCGESYCHGCIADYNTEGKPCPFCGEDNFTTLEQVKFQKKIKSQQVYCSMKGRGCDWTGALGGLDVHLDPQEDNCCLYVDIECPLNCKQAVPKCKLDEHLTKECSKRDHTCLHCGYKATYQEVVDVHLSECKYVPVQCPNFCGVTCERGDLELHMKTCRLEKIACQFVSVGCEDKFLREKEEEHEQQRVLKHVSLTASALVQEKVLAKQKLSVQKVEFEENVRKQEHKINTLEEKIVHLELALIEQGNQMGVLKKTVEDQNLKIKILEENLKAVSGAHSNLAQTQNVRISQLQSKVEFHERERSLSQVFVMKDFSSKQISYPRGKSLSSPYMYSKRNGYKFYLQIFPNGCREHNRALCISFVYTPGEFDKSLKWPVTAQFILILSSSDETLTLERHKDLPWSASPYLMPNCHISVLFEKIRPLLKSNCIKFFVTKSEFVK